MKKRYLIILVVVLSSLLFFSLLYSLTAKTWHYQTVDLVGIFQGGFSSLAIDTNGRPHVVYLVHYHDVGTDNDTLKYAVFNGSTWDKQIVDSSGYLDQHLSLVLDSNSNPHISYSDYMNNSLKYATLNGSKWVIQTVDVNYQFRSIFLQSLALDSSGNPHISYTDYMNNSEQVLKYASWTGSNWSIQIVGLVGGDGGFSSLAFDPSDNPHISYIDNSENKGALTYASWVNSNWSIQTVDFNGIARDTSLALDSKGNPHISYLCWNLTNYQLRFADYTDNVWNIQILDANASNPSFVLDSRGNSHICYTQVTTSNGFFKSENLKYAQWLGSSWNIEIVRANSWNPSLALDSASNPQISFTEDSNGGHGMAEGKPLVYAVFN
jgi:hypothetical protein